eukprot:1152257-Pelagomonas_calceolata.AAC.2
MDQKGRKQPVIPGRHRACVWAWCATHLNHVRAWCASMLLLSVLSLTRGGMDTDLYFSTSDRHNSYNSSKLHTSVGPAFASYGTPWLSQALRDLLPDTFLPQGVPASSQTPPLPYSTLLYLPYSTFLLHKSLLPPL